MLLTVCYQHFPILINRCIEIFALFFDV